MCGAFALLTQASWLSGPTLWPLLASALLLTSCTWSLQEVRNSLCVDFFTSLSLKSSSRHFNHHRQLFLAQTGVLAPLCSANKSCPCIGGFLHPILTTVAASHKRAVRHLTLASSVKALEGLGTRTFRRFPSLLRLVNPASRPPPTSFLPSLSYLPALCPPPGGGNGVEIPTPVFLPGESHGQRSLAGYSPWGRTESDTTEHTPARPPPAPCRSVPLVPSSFLFEAVLGV